MNVHVSFMAGPELAVTGVVPFTTEDRMALQGFHCGPERPGDASMNQLLGNAMSVNGVEAVLVQAAWALGY